MSQQQQSKRQRCVKFEDDAHGDGEAVVEPSPQRPSGRVRRAAADAASSSLKEPSISKKMRQGDPPSKSVYKDFVPAQKGGRRSGKNKTK